jgi:hypothetical protein
MNCIPRLTILLLTCAACGASTTEPAAPEDPSVYRLDYLLTPSPRDASVRVQLRVAQRSALLREMSFRNSAGISGLDGDGELLVDGNTVRWLPPASGGTLEWRVSVNHRRNGNGHDAWLGSDWGLFRAEDVIPRARSRTLKGAHSETWLRFDLPQNWSAVTQYFGRDDRFRIDNPERRFDQPGGWIVIGELGVRRDTIAGVKVAVAGPVGHSIRRMDILAMLNWTLPELSRLLPELPPRLTIVSAGDPMWRGGLSAPMSLYLHAERPLISENATSTLLHEVLHMSLGFAAEEGYDWIVEGLAEYYGLRILRRSGSISRERFQQARRDLEEWSREAATLCSPASTGPVTARAVMTFFALDRELRDRTDGEASLDDVTRRLWSAADKVTLAALTQAARDVAGQDLDTLHIDNLPGCRTIAAE